MYLHNQYQKKKHKTNSDCNSLYNTTTAHFHIFLYKIALFILQNVRLSDETDEKLFVSTLETCIISELR